MRTHGLLVLQGDHTFQVWGGWGAWPCMGLAGMDLAKQRVHSTHRYWLEWPNCISCAWQSVSQELCRADWSGSRCQQWKPTLVPSSVGSSFRRNQGDTEQVLFWITRFLAEDSKQLSCRGLLNRCISPCWILQSPVGFWVYTWLCGKKYFAECPCPRGRLCLWDWKGLRTSLLGCLPSLQNSFTNPSLLFPWKQLGPLKATARECGKHGIVRTERSGERKYLMSY